MLLIVTGLRLLIVLLAVFCGWLDGSLRVLVTCWCVMLVVCWCLFLLIISGLRKRSLVAAGGVLSRWKKPRRKPLLGWKVGLAAVWLPCMKCRFIGRVGMLVVL